MIEIDLQGKRGLVMGVANARSLGWAIAERLHAAGAELAFSYQGERLKEELEKLTRDRPGTRLSQCDVTREEDLEATFADLQEAWGEPRLRGPLDRLRAPAGHGRALHRDHPPGLAHGARHLGLLAGRGRPRRPSRSSNEGGAIVTLTYYAAEKVVPKYNVMGIAKSALEASVRYLAYEMGKKGVRVNAVSAGPVRTVAARSIPGFVKMYSKVGGMAPLGRNVTHEEVGNLGLFLLSPLASGITGETVYVDAGYHVMGMELGEESA